jgi:predicted alpha/beta-hydrolase family hydrolase
MLFLQGTRDALAERARMQAVIARLGERARGHWLEDADHGFHVPARTGRTDAQLRALLLDELRSWVDGLL